jgi:ribose transport system permease protein
MKNTGLRIRPLTRIGSSWTRVGLPASLAAIWVGFWILAPGFASVDNQWNITRQVAVLALASMGQTFAIVSGGLDISIGSVVALSSILAALAAGQWGTTYGFVLGAIGGMAVGITSGAIVAMFRVEPIIVTIGMLSLARGAAFYITNGIPVTAVPADYRLLGSGFVGPLPAPTVFLAAVFAITHLVLARTHAGRNLYAIGGNEEAARLAGVSVPRYQVLAYGASAALASCAGIVLSSRANSGMATLGYGLELESIAAVVIGGTRLFAGDGSIARSVLGALVIAVLGNGMDLANISPYIRQVILGWIVIGAVLVSKLRK